MAHVLVAEDGSLIKVIAAPQAVLKITHCTEHGSPYDLIRAAQQGVGQPRPSVIMPISDAPVVPPAPVPTPGSPLSSGAVPPPLSWPEPLPARPGASAPAAAPPQPPAAPAAPEPLPAQMR